MRKSKVSKGFAPDFASVGTRVTGTPALAAAEEELVHALTAEAVHRAAATLAAPAQVVAQKLAAGWQAATDELESAHRAKAVELDADIETVRRRFAVVRKKNARRRKRIEKAAFALRTRQLLLQCFATLKEDRAQGRRLARGSELVRIREARARLSRCFGAWQRLSSSAALVRRRQSASEAAQKRVEGRHTSELSRLQASIVALEKEIARVDVAHSDLSFSLSQRLLQAMSSLNVEVVELRQSELEVLQRSDKASLNLLQSELRENITTNLEKK